jgi:DNA-binding XRE family transcriptional regulator
MMNTTLKTGYGHDQLCTHWLNSLCVCNLILRVREEEQRKHRTSTITKDVRSIRRKMRLTQQELADKAGVSLSTIKNIENNPRRSYHSRIVKAVENALKGSS